MSIVIVNSIKDLVSKNRTEEAIAVGLKHANSYRKDLQKDFILLSAQYNNWKKEKNLGLVNSNETLNRINLSLLSIADQFEKKTISSKREKGVIVNIEKNKRYGFIKISSNKHNENIFFHYSNIDSKIKPQIGQRVSFELSVYKKNLVAVNIFIRPKPKQKKQPNSTPNKGKQNNRKNKFKQRQKQKHVNQPKSLVDYTAEEWMNFLKISFIELQKIFERIVSKILK